MAENKEDIIEEKEDIQPEEKTAKEKKKKNKAQQEIDQLKEELENTKDALLRTAAEYENFRKRTTKEKESLSQHAKAMAVTQILPVVDSLENAIKISDDAAKEDVLKGVQMIYNQVLTAFEKLGAEAIEGLGEQFDPETQYAVSHIESEDFGDNVVSLVMQKGYKIGDNVIRPAMVQVAN